MDKSYGGALIEIVVIVLFVGIVGGTGAFVGYQAGYRDATHYIYSHDAVQVPHN